MSHGLAGYWRGCRCDACRDAKRVSARAYYLANRERTIARAKAWADANPERTVAYKAEHYQRNHERETAKNAAYREQNRRLLSERAADYARRNPHVKRASDARRRGTPYTGEALDYMSVIANDPCVYCGGESASVDHVDPLSRGGSGDWDNLAPACRSCNSSKKEKRLLPFLLYRLREGTPRCR